MGGADCGRGFHPAIYHTIVCSGRPSCFPSVFVVRIDEADLTPTPQPNTPAAGEPLQMLAPPPNMCEEQR